MDSPSIDDAQVKDRAAWEAAIAKLREQREVHPVDRMFYPEGIGDTLVEFTARIAVAAQKKIKAGEVLTNSDWWKLAYALEPVGQIANVGMYMVADLLREHWEYGELIEEWIPKRSDDH